MTKKSALKKLTELEKIIKSPRAQEAFTTLREELESVEFSEKPANKVSLSDLVVPDEVRLNQNAFALYTDGACRGNPGPGSYGYIVQNHEGSIVKEMAAHSEHTTNNKMELTAIIEGLKSLREEVTPMHSIHVFTDSKYAVDGMKSWIIGWKKRGWKKADKKSPENLELWQSLDELQHIANVSFSWVKGHSGHPQNEYVDALANKVLDENGF